MKMTVQQAMKMKNDLANAVRTKMQTLQGYRSSVTYGRDLIDGKQLVETEDEVKFMDALESLEKGFEVSNEVNTVLAKFNATEGIGERVRSIQNGKVIVEALEAAAQKSSKTVQRVQLKVADETMEAEKVYEPYQTKKEVRKLIKDEKAMIRKMESEIFDLNAKEVEFSFDQEVLDELDI